MKNQEPKKKIWSKPAINVLDIKQVTSSGTVSGNETNDARNYGPPGLS
jgi:hypothetical protein